MEKQHFFIANQNNNDKDSFQQFVSSSDLSVRASNVLLRNVNSFEEFEQLTEKVLSKFRNCGKKTVREILSFLDIVQLERGISTPHSTEKLVIEPPVSTEELLSEPPIDSTIELLPIFSNNPLPNVSLKDLHPNFHGEVKIEDIQLSQRTFNVLKQNRMIYIGDAMLTTSADLLSLRNFGRKSLNEIQIVVRSLCKIGIYSPRHQEIESAFIDYSSYDNLVSSYSKLCLKKERNQLIMKKMFLFDTEKAPTLQEVGEYVGISRERVRQIVNKALRQFKHPANIRNLEVFWEKLDQAIIMGGGIIHLKDLPAVLQDVFNWLIEPNPIALGQFMGIRENESTLKHPEDLITVKCDCLSCHIPVAYLQSLDFSDNNSFHIAVVASRLSSHCQEKCPWSHSEKIFHRAFIEKTVANCTGLVLHEDLVLTRDNWLETHCSKLEDVACHLLECHGSPMHFTEIADAVRNKNPHFKDLSDHNLHSAIIRYESFKIVGRGTYGLTSWGPKEYRTVSNAIENFLDAQGLPQRRQQIVRHLGGEFSDTNITAALSYESRFKKIGEGFYDRRTIWEKRNLEDFIALLPDPVNQFAQYLTGRNNTSYKLVMGYIHIRSMDTSGNLYLHKLKSMFYNFYLSRYKKGLVVESESSTMSRIGEMTKNKLIDFACREPLKSFLGSGYFTRFFQKDRKLKLADAVLNQLTAPTKDKLLITILKAIDDYYSAIPPNKTTYETKSEIVPTVSENDVETEDLISKPSSDSSFGQVSIRKKRRGKIKL